MKIPPRLGRDIVSVAALCAWPMCHPFVLCENGRCLAVAVYAMLILIPTLEIGAVAEKFQPGNPAWLRVSRFRVPLRASGES